MKKANLGFYTAAVVSGLLGVVACSSNTPVDNNPIETRQCTTNQDCENLGGEFRGRVCSAEGVCVVKDQTPIGADASDTGCVSSEKCTQDLGYPSLCKTPGSKCIQLGNANCDVSGDYKATNTFTIGWVDSTRSSFASRVATSAQGALSVIWAQDEILEQTGTAGINGKKPVFVRCRGAGDGVVAEETEIQHLLDVVDVDVLMTAAFGDTLFASSRMKAGTSRARPVFDLVSQVAAREIATGVGAEPSVIFQRPQPNIDTFPFVFKQFADFEAREKTAGRISGRSRVAIIAAGGNIADSERAALIAGLQVNGGSVADGITAGEVKVLSLARNAPRNASFFQQIDPIIAFQPHAVFLVGEDDHAAVILPYLEAGFTARPAYFGSVGLITPAFISFVGTSQALASRFSMVTFPFAPPWDVPTLPKQIELAQRYYKRYPDRVGTTPLASVYDAPYYVLWASVAGGAFADGAPRITPAAFAAGLPLIVDPAGKEVALGPDTLSLMTTVTKDTKVRLRAPFASWDPDPSLGRPKGNLALKVCSTVFGGTVTPLLGTTGIQSATQTIFGTDNCPVAPISGF